MPSVIIAAAIGATAIVASTAMSNSAQKEAQSEAEQFAQDQAAAAQEEQRRLEEKYGLTPDEIEREQRMFELEKTRQDELTKRASLTGEELMRESGGEITSKLMDEVYRRMGMSSTDLFKEEGGKPAELYLESVSKEGPLDMFAPELELARTMVNQEANRRGVFGGTPEGGIRFENMGRAGVDLAIKSAAERLNQQQTAATLLTNLAQQVRGEAGVVGEKALNVEQGAETDLNTFLANLQNESAGARGRAANVALSASQNASQTTNSANDMLSTIYGIQAGSAAESTSSGLNALASLAGLVVDSATAKTSVPGKESLTELRSGTDQSILEELAGLTGSSAGTTLFGNKGV